MKAKLEQDDLASLADLLEHMLFEVVDHQDDVKVTVSRGSHSVILAFEVHPSDSGFVIGEGGATIEALRRIMSVSAQSRGALVHLDFKNERQRTEPSVVRRSGGER